MRFGSAPSVINVVASIKIKQDAGVKAEREALAWFNSLDRQQPKALVDAFPRTDKAICLHTPCAAVRNESGKLLHPKALKNQTQFIGI